MLPLCETIASGPTLISAISSTALTEIAQPGVGGDKADAVRADQAHAARPRDLEDAFLRLPAFRAGLGEAVAVDRRDRNALRRALLDGCLHRLRRHHDERVIDGSGIDAMSGYAFSPKISSRPGFTGTMRPR